MNALVRFLVQAQIAEAKGGGEPSQTAAEELDDQDEEQARIHAEYKAKGKKCTCRACKKKEINYEQGEAGDVVRCSFGGVDLEGKGTPETIVYLPKGRHTITPNVNGQPKEVTVEVDEATCAILQADLGRRLGSPIKPYAQFNHKPGAASFRPKAFRWDSDKGVMCDLEWTRAGREAIQGKDFLHFSPTFLMSSETGKIAGLPARGEIGSLTNDPAFVLMEEIGV